MRKLFVFIPNILRELMMADDEIEAWINTLPESKLELIDGQLIVGNSLTTTKLLLRHILEGWGAAAAIALIDRKLCWEALKVVYPNALTNPEWPSQVDYQPEDLSAGGQGEDCGHWWTRDLLSHQLSRAMSLSNSGQTLGRDFIMHLSDNGFTPDILAFCGEPLNYLYEWYLDGPADLVIEVILPAHAAQDREVKRHYYEMGGVPEYWIIDPKHHAIEFLRLVKGQYQPQQADAQGRYRPHSLPNLAFIPAKLWQLFSSHDHNPFTLSCFEIEDYQDKNHIKPEKKGLEYGDLPFVPRVALEPVPISFAEFVSWCPEAKIEGSEDKLEVGDTRHFLGLALMTLGMVETVKLIHPQQWVAALNEVELNELNDATKKAEWWKIAKEAATLLREKHGAKRLAVTGDLVHPQPLNFWSYLTLVTYEGDPSHEWGWTLYQRFKKNPRVHLAKLDKIDRDNNELVEI